MDTMISREADVEVEAVNANWVMTQMDFAGNPVNVIVLDSCRNNPFARSFRSANRGLAKGLAKMDAPRGSLLAYATAPGKVAVDGQGANSPYTSALAKAMTQPGLSSPLTKFLLDAERAVWFLVVVVFGEFGDGDGRAG